MILVKADKLIYFSQNCDLPSKQLSPLTTSQEAVSFGVDFFFLFFSSANLLKQNWCIFGICSFNFCQCRFYNLEFLTT